MNPETLRSRLNSIRCGGYINDEQHIYLLEHAEAWEADRKRVFDYGELITEHQGVIATLRKRLEAAEKIGKYAQHEATCKFMYHFGKAPCTCGLAEIRAALAGEEKP